MPSRSRATKSHFLNSDVRIECCECFVDASVYEDPATEMNSVDGSPFNRLGLLKQKLLPNKYLHLLFFRRPSQFVRFHSVYG
jgi:hypothetical protein